MKRAVWLGLLLVGTSATGTASANPFTLYNPWGLKGNGYAYGKYDLFTASGTFLSQNYNVATSGQAIAPTSAARPGGPADHSGAEVATTSPRRDDSVPAVSAMAVGHGRHDHEGGDGLFAEDN